MTKKNLSEIKVGSVVKSRKTGLKFRVYMVHIPEKIGGEVSYYTTTYDELKNVVVFSESDIMGMEVLP